MVFVILDRFIHCYFFLISYIFFFGIILFQGYRQVILTFTDRESCYPSLLLVPESFSGIFL